MGDRLQELLVEMGVTDSSPRTVAFAEFAWLAGQLGQRLHTLDWDLKDPRVMELLTLFNQEVSIAQFRKQLGIQDEPDDVGGE